MGTYPSDLEIANAAHKKPIDEIAESVANVMNNHCKLFCNVERLDHQCVWQEPFDEESTPVRLANQKGSMI